MSRTWREAVVDDARGVGVGAGRRARTSRRCAFAREALAGVARRSRPRPRASARARRGVRQRRRSAAAARAGCARRAAPRARRAPAARSRGALVLGLVDRGRDEERDGDADERRAPSAPSATFRHGTGGTYDVARRRPQPQPGAEGLAVAMRASCSLAQPSPGALRRRAPAASLRALGDGMRASDGRKARSGHAPATRRGSRASTPRQPLRDDRPRARPRGREVFEAGHGEPAPRGACSSYSLAACSSAGGPRGRSGRAAGAARARSAARG